MLNFQALTIRSALFKCGINPQDRAWRNLLWDEKEQKWYVKHGRCSKKEKADLLRQLHRRFRGLQCSYAGVERGEILVRR